ncbi:MAG: phosphate/phosphite/phosphonate ABC transporter substrate-binding protein [Candidatus Electrothrix sp. AUS4]|nr:phosphate/phosphite/phosphonate ABC transporter substrate-binding protein [Candidatus Electrothrix sp. AUS4]
MGLRIKNTITSNERMGRFITNEYIFAVHPLHNPQRLFEVFGPMMEYLSDNIPDASFRLEASRNYAAFDKKLYARKFHFALPNPFQTINAVDKGYKVFGKMGDDQNFRGIILVRKDSGIKKVTDLKGKAVSYPAPTALAASMMPQYYLQTHGLNVMTELDNRYVGSQESSIMNVFLGQTQAAATWPPPWKALSTERPELAEQLRVIWQTEPLLNNGLVVLPEVPDTVTQQVITLLTNLHTHEQGRNILKPMELSCYERASNDTYLPVRAFLIKFAEEVRPL